MARKTQPSALRKLKGNPGDRPLNNNEPEPDIAMPKPPNHLNEIAIKEWNRMAPLLLNLRLMTKNDMAAFASYCVTYARWVEAEISLNDGNGLIFCTQTGYQQQRPEIGVANQAMTLMHKFLVEFGMTPSSRARLEVPQEPPKDKMKNFMDKGKKSKVPDNVVGIKNGTNG